MDIIKRIDEKIGRDTFKDLDNANDIRDAYYAMSDGMDMLIEALSKAGMKSEADVIKKARTLADKLELGKYL